MRTTAGTPALLALATLLLAGCGGGGGGETSTGGDSSAAADATLHTADSDLGDIVVDADGRTVYVFDEDEPGSGASACSGDCLEQWPPVVAEDEEPTADGVDGDLGTIERDDGTLQVTLDGAPLYLFAGDGGSGDVTGHGVGDVWWAVGPDGNKIAEAPAPDSDDSY